MEKKIRYSLIILFTLLTTIIIQVAVRHLEYSFLFLCPLLLGYYYLQTKLKSIVKNSYILIEKIKDRIIGVDITNTESLDRLGIPANKGYIYEATKTRHILPFFNENAKLFTFGETIIDLGCGKGGALIALRKAGFNRIYGVEISEKLCNIAKSNLLKFKIDDVTVYHSDIMDFNMYHYFEIFYMYNPFPAEILRHVISKIEQSLLEKPRQVIIIYMNPKHHEEISKNIIFNKIGEFNYDSEKSSFRKIFLYKN
jgi:SAM-dependent methyltransferase